MDNETTKNFIETIIDEDNEKNTYGKRVHTRFPPEPNGYLHIGHAKSICLNFGIAKKYGGITNLRFDDTNPSKENTEYVESIKRDVKWLGFDWDDRMFYASDHFDKLYEYAKKLIRLGKAYVDDLSSDEIREYRGTFNTPGKESPYRNRSVEENLQLFEDMKNGKFADGEKVLRAKSIWPTRTSTNGVSIRCTTLLIPYRTPSNALPILFARWNLKPIVRCTTGSSKIGTIRKARNRGRLNSPA